MYFLLYNQLWDGSLMTSAQLIEPLARRHGDLGISGHALFSGALQSP